jgi:hypothetical protein
VMGKAVVSVQSIAAPSSYLSPKIMIRSEYTCSFRMLNA